MYGHEGLAEAEKLSNIVSGIIVSIKIIINKGR